MRRKILFRTWISCLTFVACLPAHAELAWEPAGYWTGQLGYRGDDLEVRVRIRQEDGRISGSLDIPALVYATQPLVIAYDNETSLSLDFPFGIGEITVDAAGPDQLQGKRDGFSLSIARTEAPSYVQKELQFGAVEPKLEGTLFLPPGEGPHPAVVQIADSGNATRENWSYASWVDFYLEHGVGAFIYDRRPDMEPLPDGSIAGISDHAADVTDAVRQLRQIPGINARRVGLAGGSRGAWIAMAVTRQLPDLAFLIFLSPAAATPGEQEMTSVLTGMRQDGANHRLEVGFGENEDGERHWFGLAPGSLETINQFIRQTTP
jgi:hypothetical protein